MKSAFLLLAAASSASAQAQPLTPADDSAAQTRPAGADPRMLFSSDDYPVEALKRKEQGTARAELTIGTDGRVKACKIIQSSSSTSIDTATCNVLTARAKFIPARDSNGNAVEGTYVTPPISWRLADEDSGAPPMQLVEPGRYLCDTAAGHYAQHDIMPLQPGQEMRLAVRLDEERPSEDWIGLGAVYFIGPNGKSRIAVGKARNDRTQMFVAVMTPGSEAQDVIFEYPLTSNWIILKLTLDSRGLLTVRSNDLTQRYKWGAVTRTYLHCNSGKWEFDVWPRSYILAPSAIPAN